MILDGWEYINGQKKYGQSALLFSAPVTLAQIKAPIVSRLNYELIVVEYLVLIWNILN